MFPHQQEIVNFSGTIFCGKVIHIWLVFPAAGWWSGDWFLYFKDDGLNLWGSCDTADSFKAAKKWFLPWLFVGFQTREHLFWKSGWCLLEVQRSLAGPLHLSTNRAPLVVWSWWLIGWPVIWIQTGLFQLFWWTTTSSSRLRLPVVPADSGHWTCVAPVSSQSFWYCGCCCLSKSPTELSTATETKSLRWTHSQVSNLLIKLL